MSHEICPEKVFPDTITILIVTQCIIIFIFMTFTEIFINIFIF